MLYLLRKFVPFVGFWEVGRLSAEHVNKLGHLSGLLRGFPVCCPSSTNSIRRQKPPEAEEEDGW